MKFLNHLDLVENEARRLKMYRVSSGSYTPGINTSGNIILDTSVSAAGTAGLPKWWDSAGNGGSGIWRDFSWGTAGSGSWNIQSDSGANIAVHAADTLDLTGGVAMSTVTSGTAAAPVVTFNVLDYGASPSVTGASADGDNKWYGVKHHPTTGKLQVHVPWENNTTIANTFRTVTVDTTGNGTANNTLLQSETLMLKKGTNVTLAEAAGVVTISSTDTQYSALTHSVLGLAKTRFATINNITPIALSDVTARTYGIQKNSSDQLVVTVPWANTLPPANIVNTVNTTDGTYIDLTPNSATTGAVTVTADLSAVDGTPIENERVLSKSNKWITVGSIQGVDVDVDNAHLLTRLAALESSGGAANEVIIIGADAGDTIKITGNLEVAGSTTTINTETVTIQDNMILLNSNSASTPSENAGIEVERGSSANVNMHWIESSDTWYLTESGTNANGGGLVSKKIIQNLFKTVTGNSGTATANASATALAVTGVNGITTVAANQGIEISAPGMSTGTAMTLTATSIGSATNKRANVTHALATKDVIVRTYLIAGEGGTLEEIYANVTVMSTTVVRLEFSAQPTSNVRVVITAVRTAMPGTSVAYA